jgi:hypothetical protein
VAQRFPIRFSRLNKAMVVLGILPSRCAVEVDDSEVRVRMSWAFRLTVPRTSVAGTSRDHGRIWGWGAHGWRGEWLVNGSSQGIVRIDVDPPAAGRTTGFPIEVRVLRVAVEDPEGLISALDRR